MSVPHFLREKHDVLNFYPRRPFENLSGFQPEDLRIMMMSRRVSISNPSMFCKQACLNILIFRY